METLQQLLAMMLVLAAVFFLFLFGGCVMLKTIDANSNTDNPPNVFQWTAGWECSRSAWNSYSG